MTRQKSEKRGERQWKRICVLGNEHCSNWCCCCYNTIVLLSNTIHYKEITPYKTIEEPWIYKPGIWITAASYCGKQYACAITIQCHTMEYNYNTIQLQYNTIIMQLQLQCNYNTMQL